MNVKPFAVIVAVSILASPFDHTGEAPAPTSTGAARVASAGGSQTMCITRSGTQPSQKGPAEHFTGSVRIDPLSSPTPRPAPPART